jgi:hypothetical protein
MSQHAVRPSATSSESRATAESATRCALGNHGESQGGDRDIKSPRNRINSRGGSGGGGQSERFFAACFHLLARIGATTRAWNQTQKIDAKRLATSKNRSRPASAAARSCFPAFLAAFCATVETSKDTSMSPLFGPPLTGIPRPLSLCCGTGDLVCGTKL